MKKQNLLLLAATFLTGAAVASPATDAIADVGTEAAALLAAAWPVVIAIVVGTIGIKLFKKFANKAT
ncbi:major coat protein [Rheinheimera sp.]|uniref:major coat protein n=1 Tax=Rheinheimera sp. TaxID=1869214 RepID=UPI002FDE8340